MLLKYQIITKPIIAKIKPPDLNCPLDISFNLLNIFFIFDGNKAYNRPSIKRNKPKAMISSLIIKIIVGFVFVLCFQKI